MPDLLEPNAITNTNTINSFSLGGTATELKVKGYATKGTDIMNCMLLSQYQNSPNLKEYIGAFISELDLLFEEIDMVIQGRTLECAEGVQLDIIGDILGQKRSIVIPDEYFGFVGGEISEAFDTGIFKSITELGYKVTPLNDVAYRKLLKVRAYCIGINNQIMHGEEYSSLTHATTPDDIYKIVSLLVHGTYENYLTDGLVLSYTEVAGDINLELDSALFGVSNYDILFKFRYWFTPTTKQFNITLI